MKKLTSAVMLSCFIFLSACVGRDPQPVIVERHEDKYRNCAYLVNELEVIETKIHKLLPETDKRMDNLTYGVAGYFMFFIPWLLVDFKNADATEYEALRLRHEHLGQIAKGKNCEFEARYYPSLEDVKKDYDLRGVVQGNSIDPNAVVKKAEEQEVEAIELEPVK